MQPKSIILFFYGYILFFRRHNFNAGKINIYQHIEDLKNSLTIESLNEDLNLKKEIMQILRDNNIVFRIQVL